MELEVKFFLEDVAVYHFLLVLPSGTDKYKMSSETLKKELTQKQKPQYIYPHKFLRKYIYRGQEYTFKTVPPEISLFFYCLDTHRVSIPYSNVSILTIIREKNFVKILRQGQNHTVQYLGEEVYYSHLKYPKLFSILFFSDTNLNMV